MFKRLTSGSSKAAAPAAAADTPSDGPSSPTSPPAGSGTAAPLPPVSSSSASSPTPQQNGQQGVKKFFSIFTPRRTLSGNNSTLPASVTSPSAAAAPSASSSSPRSTSPPTLSESSSFNDVSDVWAEASAALLHDWTQAGLIPADRWQLDHREAPGRQRKRLRVHSDFYDEYRLHLLPFSMALLRLRWNRDAVLSLPLLDMKAGEAPVRTVNRLIPRLMKEAAEAQQRHEQQQLEEGHTEEGEGDKRSGQQEVSTTPNVVLGEPSSPTPTAVMDMDSRREATNRNRHSSDDAQREDDNEAEGEDGDGDEQNDAFNLTSLALPRISVLAINKAKLTKTKAAQQRQQVEGDEEGKDADEEDGEDNDEEAEEEEEADDAGEAEDEVDGPMSADNSIDEVGSESGSEEEEEEDKPSPTKQAPKPSVTVATVASPKTTTSLTADLVSPSASQALSILTRLLQPHDSIPAKNGLFGCQRIQYLQQQSAVLLLTAHRLYIVHYFTVQDGKVRLTPEPPVTGLAAQSYQIKAKLRPMPTAEQHSSKGETSGAGEAETSTEGAGSGEVPLLPSGEVDTSQLDVVLQADKVKKSSDELEALVALQQFEAQCKQQELLDGQFAPSDHCCFDYSQLASIHRRRCQLRPTGIELLCTDGSSHLLSFDSKKERETVFALIAKRAEARIRSRSGQKGSSESNGAGSPSAATVINTLTPTLNRSSSLAAAASASTFSPFAPAELDGGIVLKQKHIAAITERWVQGQLSNYDYLMFVNTAAGRSFNDLTQYPVFPWVLSDYTSERLDLNDKRVYRDLSKPMGAIGDARARLFRERYKTWEDPSGQIPRFHYGTHYSSSAITLYFLLRLHPFTHHALQLQGGKFDHADRLFHDIQHTWQSAAQSTAGLSDVKELIPEFYTLPAFLSNDARWDLGEKQRGGWVDDVTLPPWAQGDPALFVRRMREALESDHVGEHLHSWIDLVFGVKQKGKAAVKAQNVFYYLTYEDVVDIDAIEDDLERRATIDQINNFGCTPHQLFKHPHPQRRVTEGKGGKAVSAGSGESALQSTTITSHPQLLHVADNQPNLSNVPTIAKGSRKPIAAIHYAAGLDRLLVLDEHKSLLPADASKYMSWGHADTSLRICVLERQPASLRQRARQVHDIIAGHAGLQKGAITAAVVTDDLHWLVTGGDDGCVCVHRVHVGRNRFEVTQPKERSLHGHAGAITALSASAEYSMIVSGGADCQVLVWDVPTFTLLRRLPPHPAPITCVAIQPSTGDIVTCSGPHLYVWTVNGELVAERTVGSSSADSVDAVAVTAIGSNGLEYVILTGCKDGAIKAWSLEVDQTHAKPLTLLRRASRSTSASSATQPPPPPLAATAKSSAKSAASRSRSPRAIPRGQVSLGTPFLVLSLRQTLYGSGSSITVLHAPPSAPARFYSGDHSGNVIHWELSNQDHWQKDVEARECAICEVRFGVIERRHHCRRCGRCVCGKCSSRKQQLPDLAFNKPVRVCDDCWLPAVVHLHKPII